MEAALHRGVLKNHGNRTSLAWQTQRHESKRSEGIVGHLDQKGPLAAQVLALTPRAARLSALPTWGAWAVSGEQRRSVCYFISSHKKESQFSHISKERDHLNLHTAE